MRIFGWQFKGGRGYLGGSLRVDGRGYGDICVALLGGEGGVCGYLGGSLRAWARRILGWQFKRGRRDVMTFWAAV